MEPWTLPSPLQGVDAAAGHAHVAEQKLDDGHRPDVLGAHRMLRPAHGVAGGGRPVRPTRRAEELVYRFAFVLWRSGDVRDLVGGVTGIVFFQELEHAVRVLQGRILLRTPFCLSGRTRSSCRISCPFRCSRRTARPVRRPVEIRTHEEGGVGVIDDIFLEVELVLLEIVDHSAEEGDVRAGTDRGVEIRRCRGLRKAGVDQISFAPRSFAGMIHFMEIGWFEAGFAAHYQDNISIFQVDPVIRHCTASERLSQSRYSRAVSDTRLVLDITGPHDRISFRRR